MRDDLGLQAVSAVFGQDGGVGKTSSPAFSPTRLAKAREAAGLSNAELAKQLGVRRQEVVRWQARSSPRTPQPQMQLRLARALGVEVADLVEREVASLAALRTAQGLRQADLAELAGLPRSTVQALETGKIATLRSDQAERIAHALKSSPETIVQAHRVGVVASQQESSATQGQAGRSLTSGGPEVADFLELADGVEQLVRVLRLSPDVEQQVIEAAHELRAEASSVVPDHRCLREQVDKINDGLKDASPTVGKRAMLTLVRAARRALAAY